MTAGDERAPTLPGKAESLWLGTTPRTGFGPLQGDVEVDVAVLGAGIAGVTTAVLLKEAGRRVALLDARRAIEGVTGNTTAKVTSLHRMIYADLVERHGEETARLYGAANQAAIERVARFVAEKRIDCDFAPADAFTYTEHDADVAQVEEEVRVAASIGLPATLETDIGLPFPVRAAVRFRDQARFHPRKYLLALVGSLPGDGSSVFEDTTATEVHGGSPCRVETPRGTVRAKSVVIATHQPFPVRGFYFARMTLKRSYALALRIRGAVPKGMYISTDADFRSMRPQELGDREVLILGGEPHRPGQGGDTAAMVRRLEQWARERFDVESVEYRWATQDNVTSDRIPYVGRFVPGSRHVYAATGFGGWGMTNGTAAGMLLSDLVLGRSNPWERLFDPARGLVASTVSGLARDAVTGVKDLTGAFEVGARPDAVAAIPRGEGRVIDRGIDKLAIHRDDAGRLHVLSAVCTHLQCIVGWNSADQSWDCPCHGSRFDVEGRVLQGPALEDLPKADLHQESP